MCNHITWKRLHGIAKISQRRVSRLVWKAKNPKKIKTIILSKPVEKRCCLVSHYMKYPIWLEFSCPLGSKVKTSTIDWNTCEMWRSQRWWIKLRLGQFKVYWDLTNKWHNIWNHLDPVFPGGAGQEGAAGSGPEKLCWWVYTNVGANSVCIDGINQSWVFSPSDWPNIDIFILLKTIHFFSSTLANLLLVFF